GTWSIPDFAAIGSMTVSLSVDSTNNAMVTVSVQGNSIFGGEAPPAVANGTFNADGELIINGRINVRIRADGAFNIFVIVDSNAISTPAGFAAWYAFNGEITGSRVAGAITMGHVNSSVVLGSFNTTR